MDTPNKKRGLLLQRNYATILLSYANKQSASVITFMDVPHVNKFVPT